MIVWGPSFVSGVDAHDVLGISTNKILYVKVQTHRRQCGGGAPRLGFILTVGVGGICTAHLPFWPVRAHVTQAAALSAPLEIEVIWRDCCCWVPRTMGRLSTSTPPSRPPPLSQSPTLPLTCRKSARASEAPRSPAASAAAAATRAEAQSSRISKTQVSFVWL
jgi:hypothetical protein